MFISAWCSFGVSYSAWNVQKKVSDCCTGLRKLLSSPAPFTSLHTLERHGLSLSSKWRCILKRMPVQNSLCIYQHQAMIQRLNTYHRSQPKLKHLLLCMHVQNTQRIVKIVKNYTKRYITINPTQNTTLVPNTFLHF